VNHFGFEVPGFGNLAVDTFNRSLTCGGCGGLHKGQHGIYSVDILAEAEMPAVGKRIVRLGAQAVDVLGNVMQG